MLELAELVIEMTGSTSSIVYRPLPTDDPSSASPTSRWPGGCSAGSRRSSCVDGLRRTIDEYLHDHGA